MKSHEKKESSIVYYAELDGKKVEVTAQNLSKVKEANATVCQKTIPPQGYTSPIDLVVDPDKLDALIESSSSVSDNQVLDTKVHANIDGLQINVTPNNYKKLADLDVTFSLAESQVEDGYTNPIEIVLPNESVPFYLPPQNIVPQVPPTQLNRIMPTQKQSVMPLQQQVMNNSISSLAVTNKPKSSRSNATIMAKMLASKYKFVKMNDGIYIWNGYYYKFLTIGEQKSMCLFDFESDFIQTGSIGLLKAVVEFLHTILPEKDLPEDASHLIMFNNGVFDMNNGYFYLDTSRCYKYFIRHAVEAFYAPNIQCPIFEKYLFTLAGGNQILINRFWEVIGMMLSSDIQVKRIVVLEGVGGSGKSTFANIIKMLIKDENVTAYNPKGLMDKFSGAKLVNSAVNVCMDLPCIPLTPEIVAQLKNFSGGDLVEGDVKYMPGFSYVFQGHLLFCSNYPIKITYEDEAFAERLLLLPCNYKIPQDARNHNLLTQIKSELSAIATKAVLAYTNVRNRNYQFSGDDIWRVTAQSLCQSSGFDGGIVLKFLNEKCTVTNSQTDYTPTAELFNRFTQFCTDNDYYNGYNANSFSRELGRLVPDSVSKKIRKGQYTVNVRTCIKLKE